MLHGAGEGPHRGPHCQGRGGQAELPHVCHRCGAQAPTMFLPQSLPLSLRVTLVMWGCLCPLGAAMSAPAASSASQSRQTLLRCPLGPAASSWFPQGVLQGTAWVGRWPTWRPLPLQRVPRSGGAGLPLRATPLERHAQVGLTEQPEPEPARMLQRLLELCTWCTGNHAWAREMDALVPDHWSVINDQVCGNAAACLCLQQALSAGSWLAHLLRSSRRLQR